MKQHYFIAIACTFVLFFSACKKDKKETPTTTTEDPKLTFTDSRDSKTYLYVKIGNQYWMQENLRYDAVAAGTSDCYDDVAINCNEGTLYNLLGAQNACPSGWHLPSDAEFRTLETYIGFSAADTAKKDGTASTRGDCSALKTGGSSGFNVGTYSGSYYHSSSAYEARSTEVSYWSSDGYQRVFQSANTLLRRYSPTGGYSDDRNRYCVRCLKD
jgi:uncharacterized protein (TIGR02145 family)